MSFKPNQKCKRKYNQVFRVNPEAANLFLLLCELADENGEVPTDPEELADLMAVRFENPKERML